MFNKLYLIGLLAFSFSLIMLFSGGADAAPNITIVNGSCTGGLVCLFSINSTQNAHAGECGFYNVSVCGNYTSANIRSSSCNSGESGVLSFLQKNNTHVGQFGVINYDNHVCVDPNVSVSLRGSCNSDETCLVSINSTGNSHVAECNYFGNQVCLGSEQVGPTTSLVNGSCTGGLTCVFSINASTNAHAGECNFYNVSVCADITTSSMRSNACDLNAGEVGLLSFFQKNNTHVGQFGVSNYENNTCVTPNVSVNVRSACNTGETCLVSINSTNNSHVAECNYFGNQVCLGNTNPTILPASPDTLVINASSLYTITGIPVTSGTVTAVVLETGESNTTVITESEWSLMLVSPTAFSNRVANVRIFVNDSSGKSGYYDVRVGTGTQPDEPTTCTTNKLKLTGTAVDPGVGSLSSSGTVRVDVAEVGFSNSTSYSNSVWDITVEPCLILGKIYDFDVLLTDDNGRTGLITLRQIAK